MVLTQHRGYVQSFDGDLAVIALRAGGKLTVNRGDLQIGQKVAIIPNCGNTEIIDVIDLAEAERAVRCGEDPIFAASIRNPDDDQQDDWETLPSSDELENLRPEEDEYGNEIKRGEDDDIYGIA